jgi:acyl dehydratase
MTDTVILTLDGLAGAVGTEYGPSEWLEITQQRVDTFADATGDHQYIHVDPERAKDGPFGGTIAHGFLTLSLIIPLWTQIFDVDGVATKVNHGLNRVRFTAPVKVGARVRLRATLSKVEQIQGGVQLTTDAVVDVEGQDRPAAVAELLARFYG